jgi:hypothetical protein
MSERFLRGGRLLAFGRGPYATDAQHVSVEFVHPVIVGKRRCRPWTCRSLPAVARSDSARRRYGDGVWPAGGRSGSAGGARSLARARRAMTFACPALEGDYAVAAHTPHPFMHQELIEMLYHVLWETVHVFFEHRELGLDTGDAASFIPSSAGRSRRPDDVVGRSGRIHPAEGAGRCGSCARVWPRNRRKPSPLRRKHATHCVARRQADSVWQRRLGHRRQRLGARLRVAPRPKATGPFPPSRWRWSPPISRPWPTT